MLKKVVLRIRNRIARKKHNINRVTVPFSQASKIGILIKDIPQEAKIINKFITEFTKEGKQVDILCYSNKSKKKQEESKKNYKFNYSPITSRDIKWNGKFKSKKINNFIKTDYDYLFSLNTSPFLPFENILVKSKAKCRIGCFQKKKESYYEFMIHDGKKSLKSLVEQMIFFTRKIE